MADKTLASACKTPSIASRTRAPMFTLTTHNINVYTIEGLAEYDTDSTLEGAQVLGHDRAGLPVIGLYMTAHRSSPVVVTRVYATPLALLIEGYDAGQEWREWDEDDNRQIEIERMLFVAPPADLDRLPALRELIDQPMPQFEPILQALALLSITAEHRADRQKSLRRIVARDRARRHIMPAFQRVTKPISDATAVRKFKHAGLRLCSDAAHMVVSNYETKIDPAKLEKYSKEYLNSFLARIAVAGRNLLTDKERAQLDAQQAARRQPTTQPRAA